MVLCPPALHKAHTDGAHFREFVNCLESVIYALTQQCSKLLVIEDLKAASGRDFAHCGGVKAVMVVTVTTLHEYRAVTETLCKHLPTNIVQVHTCNRLKHN